MESQRRLEERVSISRRNACNIAEASPVDIFSEIFSRLPVKAVAIGRCVSKPWAYMLHSPEFTELFLTKSRARPQFLFVCSNYRDRKLLFFSAPQPQDLDENPAPVAATFLMELAFDNIGDIYSPIDGLFGFTNCAVWGDKDSATVVCNPTTRQSFTLPNTVHLRSCVGYDPIGKEFKVLSIQDSQEHQVLTLGTGQPSWRMVHCGITHYPGREVVCINGVMYYEAAVDRSSRTSMIACFDVRTETFSFIQLPEAVTSVVNESSGLVNYNGSLALFVGILSTNLVICILEDAETHKWSTHTYTLDFGLYIAVQEGGPSFVGVTGANEFVFSYYSLPDDLFYVTFYNFERNTYRKVAIQGMGATKVHPHVHTFLNHVENVKLM